MHTMKAFDSGLAIVFFLTLGAYHMTLCPTVYAGDSGDFITASYTFGISQPGGYPIYMILGRVFSLLPLGSVAYRYNLMSALFSSLASCILYLIGRELRLSKRACVGAGIISGISRPVWGHATIAGPDALGGFFTLLVTWLLLKYFKEPKKRIFSMASAAFGFSLANDVSSMVHLPAFAYLIWANRKKQMWHEDISMHIRAFFAPLALYAYIPLAANAGPAYGWGVSDTAAGMFRHVIAGFHRGAAHLSFDGISLNFGVLAGIFTKQHPLYLGLVILGLYGLGKRLSVFFWFTAIAVLSDMAYAFFVGDAAFGFESYVVSSFLLLGLWFGAGLEVILYYVGGLSAKTQYKGAVKTIIVISVVLVVGLVNFEYSDRSKNHVAYDYANNIIRTVEYDMVSEGFDEAVVFAQGDNIVFPLYYVLLVERPDLNIRVIERTGIINHDFYGGEFAGLEKEVREIEGQKRESSVFIEGTPAYYTSGEDVIYDGYELEQRGLLHRVLEKDAGGSDFEYWSLYVYRQIWNTSIELDPMSKELRKLYYKKLAGYHLGFDRERAAYLLELAVDMSPDDAMLRHELGNVLVGNRQYERAIAHLEVAAMMQPENQRIINNMGFAFSMMGENSKARQQYLKALSIDPGYAPARANLAGLLLESGELSKATEHYSIVIRQDPKNANAYLNLARIAHMNQNHQAAATLWQHYLELEPESPIAGEIRTYIEDVRNRQSESETDGG